MAKSIVKIQLFVSGTDEGPGQAMFTYSVVDGLARKDNNVYTPAEPNFSLSLNDFASAGITAIHTLEGVA